MKNWKTTLLGIVAGIAPLIVGILTKDTAKITEGVALILMGLVAKDHDQTGI